MSQRNDLPQDISRLSQLQFVEQSNNTEGKPLCGIAFDHGFFPKIVAIHTVENRNNLPRVRDKGINENAIQPSLNAMQAIQAPINDLGSQGKFIHPDYHTKQHVMQANSNAVWKDKVISQNSYTSQAMQIQNNAYDKEIQEHSADMRAKGRMPRNTPQNLHGSSCFNGRRISEGSNAPQLQTHSSTSHDIHASKREKQQSAQVMHTMQGQSIPPPLEYIGIPRDAHIMKGVHTENNARYLNVKELPKNTYVIQEAMQGMNSARKEMLTGNNTTQHLVSKIPEEEIPLNDIYSGPFCQVPVPGFIDNRNRRDITYHSYNNQQSNLSVSHMQHNTDIKRNLVPSASTKQAPGPALSSDRSKQFTINYHAADEMPKLLPIAANMHRTPIHSAQDAPCKEPSNNNKDANINTRVNQQDHYSTGYYPAPVVSDPINDPVPDASYQNGIEFQSAAQFSYDHPVDTQSSTQHAIPLTSSLVYPERVLVPNGDGTYRIAVLQSMQQNDPAPDGRTKLYDRPSQEELCYPNLLRLENKYDLLHVLKIGAEKGRFETYHIIMNILQENFIDNSMSLLETLKTSDLTERTKERVLSVLEEIVWRAPPRLDVWNKNQNDGIDLFISRCNKIGPRKRRKRASYVGSKISTPLKQGTKFNPIEIRSTTPSSESTKMVLKNTSVVDSLAIPANKTSHQSTEPSLNIDRPGLSSRTRNDAEKRPSLATEHPESSLNVDKSLSISENKVHSSSENTNGDTDFKHECKEIDASFQETPNIMSSFLPIKVKTEDKNVISQQQVTNLMEKKSSKDSSPQNIPTDGVDERQGQSRSQIPILEIKKEPRDIESLQPDSMTTEYIETKVDVKVKEEENGFGISCIQTGLEISQGKFEPFENNNNIVRNIFDLFT